MEAELGATAPAATDDEGAGADGRTPRRAPLTRGGLDIVDTAARLFAERGFDAVGVADLCKALGIGKAALYTRIGSKEALLEDIHMQCLDLVLRHAEEVVISDVPPTDKLRALGTFMLDLIARKPHHIWVFLHEMRGLRGERAQRARAGRHRYEDIVQSVIEDGIAVGAIKVPDARLAAFAWLGLFIHPYTWLRASGPHDARSIASQFSDLFLFGAVPRVPRSG